MNDMQKIQGVPRYDLAQPQAWALITGASSGLGAIFARYLVQTGRCRHFYLLARREERLAEQAEQLKQWGAEAVLWTSVDLGVADARDRLPQAWAEAGIQHFSWVINAAGFGDAGRFEDLSLKQVEELCRLNIEALTALTHLVRPFLVRGSKVIQIASVAAFLPQPGFAVYAASKAYVLSFSRALQVEWKKAGIEVLSVCPGPMETEFFSRQAGGQGEISRIKRIGMESPHRVVQLAVDRAEKGRSLSLSHLSAYALRVLSKIVPHRWILAAMQGMGFGASSEEKASH